jgi:hypothetical protein
LISHLQSSLAPRNQGFDPDLADRHISNLMVGMRPAVEERGCARNLSFCSLLCLEINTGVGRVSVCNVHLFFGKHTASLALSIQGFPTLDI